MQILIGEVLSIGKNFSIIAGGAIVSADRIYCASSILQGYNPTLKGTLRGTGYAGAEVIIDVDGSELVRADFGLNVGDRILCLSPDNRTFYVLERVVKL